jgi:AcrR family transcriptional regulator
VPTIWTRASVCLYPRAVTSATTSSKPRRADARRNYEALLAAGKAVFAQCGADAPFEEVARQAGVGQGTLYRHFPTREHLLVAIVKERAELLDARARELLDAPDPLEALVAWLRMYDQSAIEYGGMHARIGDWLADDGSPMAGACGPMRTSFVLLFERARRAGTVRPDVTAIQVLTMISALPRSPGRGDSDPYLDIVLYGLRSHP